MKPNILAVAGKFKLDVIRPDGSVRVSTPWFDNLILDNGLDRLLSEQQCVSSARVGSSNVPVSPGQVQMGSTLAVTTTVQSELSGNSSTAPYYGWYRRTYRFAAGVAAGNVAEVGVGWATTGAAMLSRALVRDSFGSPTVITVLSDETLDVTYELQMYAPGSDVAFTFTMSGVTYNAVMRASNATNALWQPTVAFTGAAPIYRVEPYSGDIAAVTASPNGTGDTSAAVVASAYTAGSFSRSYTSTIGLNAANFGAGGIRSALIRSNAIGTFQCSFDPPIAKDSNKILTLNYTYTIARR